MKNTSKVNYLVFILYIHILLIKIHGKTFSNKNEKSLRSDNQCVTVGGKDIGVPCKFPFKYDIWDDVPYAPATILRWPWFHKEKVFENCTSYRKSGGRKWCATKITSSNRYIPGYWGECPETLECNLLEGAWLAWSNWSEWSKCTGGRCRIPNVLPELFGRQKQTRSRRKFSRKLEMSGRNKKGAKEAQITQGNMKITKKDNIETQMDSKICHMPKCKVCDNSGTEKKFRAGLALEECKSRCVNDDKCLSFESGKGGRKGECYLNHDRNVKYRGQVHFDGWRKSSNCSIHDTEDNRIFQMIQRVELVNQMMGIMREEEPFYDKDISYDKSKEICCVLFLPVERRNRKMKNGRPFRNV